MKSLIAVLVVFLSCLTLGQMTARYYLIDSEYGFSKLLESSEESDNSDESEKDQTEEDLDDFLTNMHLASLIDQNISSHSDHSLFISKIICLDKDVPPPRFLS